MEFYIFFYINISYVVIIYHIIYNMSSIQNGFFGRNYLIMLIMFSNSMYLMSVDSIFTKKQSPSDPYPTCRPPLIENM